MVREELGADSSRADSKRTREAFARLGVGGVTERVREAETWGLLRDESLGSTEWCERFRSALLNAGFDRAVSTQIGE